MNAQKSNGSPVINDTGIEAFMFFICRTKYGRPSIVVWPSSGSPSA